MSDMEQQSGLAAPTHMGVWSLDDAEAFETARDLITALVSAYSARIASAEADEAARLRSEQQTYLAERRSLSVRDTEEVQRVLRDYPALLRAVRADNV
ncbi:hypothetical protein [Streptomyces sp. NPDC058486]|uniref:hypothetical protein n=1 Tax=unclassified Streptomyces TaxID=2593676 RepID=UPI0036630483